jgi:hypothetical protein
MRGGGVINTAKENSEAILHAASKGIGDDHIKEGRAYIMPGKKGKCTQNFDRNT